MIKVGRLLLGFRLHKDLGLFKLTSMDDVHMYPIFNIEVVKEHTEKLNIIGIGSTCLLCRFTIAWAAKNVST